MSWDYFIYFAVVAVLLWAVGAWAAWKDKTGMAYTTTIIGMLVFFSFILSMWISLERPPLRTMGETRLWYSFFLPLAGLIVYSRWNYKGRSSECHPSLLEDGRVVTELGKGKWILSFSTILALVFICVNLFKPEIHDKTLMPALQSPWFAPHVIVYMFAYAVLGVATLMALWMLIKDRNHNSQFPIFYYQLDDLVYAGLAFLTIGMLFGALWAKEAWGHYWSWDPKETWAAITWLAYLIYVHYRQIPRHHKRVVLWILIISFVLLQMCWWGINYLPSAQGSSVHTYNISE